MLIVSDVSKDKDYGIWKRGQAGKVGALWSPMQYSKQWQVKKKVNECKKIMCSVSDVS